MKYLISEKALFRTEDWGDPSEVYRRNGAWEPYQDPQDNLLVTGVEVTPTEASRFAGWLHKGEDKLEHAEHDQKSHGNWARGIRKADSPKLARWLGKSKIVDEDGEPVVLYHGTTQTFTDFDTGQFDAAEEGNFGVGIYMTNQTDDADNYAGIGPDMENKIERRVEALMNEAESNETMNGEPFGDIGYNDQEDKAREIATKELVGHGGAIMPLYVRMEEPFYVGGDNDTYLDVTVDEVDSEGRTPEDPDFDHETAELYGQSGKMHEFLLNLQGNMNQYEDGDNQKVLEDLGHLAYEGGKASEVMKVLRESEGLAYIADYDKGVPGGILVGSEVIRQSIEDTGFDGIVDSNVNNKFGTNVRIPTLYGGVIRGQGMPGVDPDTVHYIVFNDNQVKSATGNKGEFSLDSNDITEHADHNQKDHGNWAKGLKAESYGDAVGRGQYDETTLLRDKDGSAIGKVKVALYRGEARVQWIEVSPQHRRKGVASRLMEIVKEKYPDEKIVISNTTEDGNAFFGSRKESILEHDAEIHPGTGTDQSVHAGKGGGVSSIVSSKFESMNATEKEIAQFQENIRPHLVAYHAALDESTRAEGRRVGSTMDRDLREQRQAVFDDLKELADTKKSIAPEDKDALRGEAAKYHERHLEETKLSNEAARLAASKDAEIGDLQTEIQDLRISAGTRIQDLTPEQAANFPRVKEQYAEAMEKLNGLKVEYGEAKASEKIHSANAWYFDNVSEQYAELYDKATIDYAEEPQLGEYFPSTYNRRTDEGAAPEALKNEERDLAKILQGSVDQRAGYEINRQRVEEQTDKLQGYRNQAEQTMAHSDDFSPEWWQARNERNNSDVNERESRMLENQLAVSVAAVDEEIAGYTTVLEKIRDEIDPGRVAVREAAQAERRKHQNRREYRTQKYFKSDVEGDWDGRGKATFNIPDDNGESREFEMNLDASTDLPRAVDDKIEKALRAMRGDDEPPNFMSFMFSEEEGGGTGITGKGGAKEVFRKVGQLVKQKLEDEDPVVFSFTGSARSRVGLYRMMTKLLPKTMPGFVGVSDKGGAESGSTHGTFAFVDAEVWDYLSDESPGLIEDYVVLGRPDE